MISKKSQSSIELIMVIGVTGMMLLFSLFSMKLYAINSTDDMVTKQIERIGEGLTSNADIVNIFGYPSRRVVEYYFPENIINISVVGEHVVFIEYRLSEATTYAGFYSRPNITILLDEDDIYQGRKNLLFWTDEDNGEVFVGRWRKY